MSTSAVLDGSALDQLRGEFRGEIVEPGDPAYDELRIVFNGMFDRRPLSPVSRASTTASSWTCAR
jgi:hypothetical protein